MSNIICVTGATGFVGRYVTAALLAKGFTVRVLARRSSFSKLAKHVKLTMIEGDVLDSESLREALEGCDALVHLVGARRAQMKLTGLTYEDVDLGSVNSAISAMKSTGVKRIILLSAGAIGNSEYVRVKKLAEAAVKKANLDWTILRPSFIVGKGQMWPKFIGPLLNVMALLPGKLGDIGSRARNVTLAELANTIVWALRTKKTVGQILEVDSILRIGNL